MNDRISVEVVLALPETQLLVTVSLPSGATAADALRQCEISERLPDLDTQKAPIGVWGHVVDFDHRLKDGDRVEVYRPLKINPREARRQLAQAGRTMSQGDD